MQLILLVRSFCHGLETWILIPNENVIIKNAFIMNKVFLLEPDSKNVVMYNRMIIC